ncbi:DUF4861 domain-containing protein [Reichenbachiella agarivorans]|uniref:DUF4861 domain-containing protein n=1 Tax=Reichenbachiella agarivorans TaxID=2979464 RepID=A0ABY6CPD5_9BACT|nr:DUF4861 domain-containing protein [Reichenbachiella agarivorans]UXP32376.1 DUF4861 domain-containing protein [Reichenbachiella agarivorans]
MTKDRKTFLKNITWAVVGACVVYGCASQGAPRDRSITLALSNPLATAREEVVTVSVPEDIEVRGKVLKTGFYQSGQGQIECVDLDGNGLVDQLYASIKLGANESVSFDLLKDLIPITDQSQKKTQAELSVMKGGQWNGRKYEGGTGFVNVDHLRVADEHTDHSFDIRYEGPGWENEQIGYRFYLDWRNAMDIFGKKVDTLVLQQVGQDGFDSYHEDSPWGMDVLKAGKTLGIGSIGQFVAGTVEHFEQTDSVLCHITLNGNISSIIDTRYYGWATSVDKMYLESTLKIDTKDRAVEHQIKLDQMVSGFCTGLVKKPDVEKLESLVEANGWAYIATYGQQSLAGDNLGLAIVFNAKDVDYVKEAEKDHVVVFKPTTEKFSYYLLGAWEQEKNGITTKEAFKTYLNGKVERLNNPVIAKVVW